MTLEAGSPTSQMHPTYRTPVIHPTFHGHISTIKDAEHLIDSCEKGLLPIIPHRPTKEETVRLVRSGNIFVYRVNPSLQRWTDCRYWSSGRSSDGFIEYYENEVVPQIRSPDVETRQRARHGRASRQPRRQFTPKVGGLVRQTYSRGEYRVVAYYSVDDVAQDNLVTPTEAASILDASM